MSETIRILLADDHPAFRVGLYALLSQAPDILVIAETSTGTETLAQIENLRPAVVILDCHLPEMDGLAVMQAVRDRNLPVRVIALSAYSHDRYVRGMMQAGVMGYLLKDEVPEKIVEAVRAAAKGEQRFSAKIVMQMAEWTRGDKSQEAPVLLTEREQTIVRLVTQGKTNREIGKTLGISEKTVEKNLSGIFAKLSVNSRAGVAVWYARQELKEGNP